MKYAIKILLEALFETDVLIRTTMPEFKDELEKLEKDKAELQRALRNLTNKP